MERTSKHFRKRDAILNCVRSTDAHPSADWVFEHVKQQVPDISLATVYRNLALFKEQGLVISVGTVNGVERFDADTEPHVHFICRSCHKVDDLPGMIIPESLTADVDRHTGGRTETCSLSFTGTCRDCLSQA
mgnify:CR=1 FL=1